MPLEITNVFHVTADGDYANYGDRIPLLNIHKDGYFQVCSSVNWDKNYCITKDIVLGKPHQMAIIQYKQSQKYWYKVIIDDETEELMENHQARSFPNVKFYLSDPWTASFSSNLGSVCNLNWFGKLGLVHR